MAGGRLTVVKKTDPSTPLQLAADKRVTVIPAVNQCNHAVANHNSTHNANEGGSDATVAYCKANGISYSAFSPLEGLNGPDTGVLT